MSEKKNIRDKKAFEQYQKLKNHKLIREGELITSDPSMEPIRLGKAMMMGGSYFDDLIEHLEEEEQQGLQKQFQEYKNLRGAISRAGRVAFINPTSHYSSEANELLKQRSIELIELFGSFLSTDQVFKIVTQEWGLEIAKYPLKKFQQDYEREITKKKEEYKTEWNSLRLSHKRAWLEELEELYIDRKNIYYTEGKNRLDYIQLLNTLKLVRDVTVDAGQKLDVHVSGRVEAVINHTIGQEILKNLPVLEIIVGRVASQLKINPSTIIERLHTSIYTKFNGVGTTDISDFDEQPMYPSQMVYDWRRIEKIHEITQPLEDIEYQEVTDEEKVKGTRLLEIIGKKVQDNKQFLTLMNRSIKKNIEDSKE